MALTWLLILALAGLGQAGKRVPRNHPHGELGAVHLIHDASPRSTSVAICRLVSSTGHNVNGDIVFRQGQPHEPVEITGMISGLAPGLHGFHVHEKADLSDNCKGAGPHFNPEMKHHGAPYDASRHVGDLGNIPADASGASLFQMMDSHVSLFTDNPKHILGRSIVVHEKEDDLGRGKNEESLKTGNAGSRVACCIIEPANQFYPASTTY